MPTRGYARNAMTYSAVVEGLLYHKDVRAMSTFYKYHNCSFIEFKGKYTNQKAKEQQSKESEHRVYGKHLVV